MFVSARFGAQYAYIPKVTLYRPPNRRPTMLEVIGAVSEVLNIDPTEILSDRRHRRITLGRHLACYTARKLTYLSFPQIGRAIRRDHTAVMHGCDKIEKLMEANVEVGFFVKQIFARLGA